MQKITGPNSSLFLWTSILKGTNFTLFTNYFFRSLFGNCIGARANNAMQESVTIICHNDDFTLLDCLQIDSEVVILFAEIN